MTSLRWLSRRTRRCTGTGGNSQSARGWFPAEKLTAKCAKKRHHRREINDPSFRNLLEVPFWRGLVGADAADFDLRLEVILAFDGHTGHPAQDGDLADVGEGIGDRALK